MVDQKEHISRGSSTKCDEFGKKTLSGKSLDLQPFAGLWLFHALLPRPPTGRCKNRNEFPKFLQSTLYIYIYLFIMQTHCKLVKLVQFFPVSSILGYLKHLLEGWIVTSNSGKESSSLRRTGPGFFGVLISYWLGYSLRSKIFQNHFEEVYEPPQK